MERLKLFDVLGLDITLFRRRLDQGVIIGKGHIFHLGGFHAVDALLQTICKDRSHAQHLGARFPQYVDHLDDGAAG